MRYVSVVKDGVGFGEMGYGGAGLVQWQVVLGSTLVGCGGMV